MRKPKSFAFIIVVLAAAGFCGESEGAEWVPYTAGGTACRCHYDKDSLERRTAEITRVAVRCTETGDARCKDGKIKSLLQQGVPPTSYVKYGESKSLLELNCRTGEVRLLWNNDYDTEGKVLDSIAASYPQWSRISGRPDMEMLQGVLCTVTEASSR
jgi:hypothetical protein